MVYSASIEGAALHGRASQFVITAKCGAFRGHLGPRSLIFGNLVCLSLGASPFENVVWGRVVERSLKPKAGSVDVVLQFPDELNRLQGFELAMTLLQSAGRQLIMAESPVYFQAYSAVLKVLQGLRPESL